MRKLKEMNLDGATEGTGDVEELRDVLVMKRKAYLLLNSPSDF